MQHIPLTYVAHTLLKPPLQHAPAPRFTANAVETTRRRFRFLRQFWQRFSAAAIFFDNLDRRSDALQEQAFLLATAIAEEWAAMVFVCLRPGTMQRSQARGVLDTLAPRVIVIPPPKTNIVLRKRFQYAAKYARRDLPNKAYARASFTEDIEAQLPRAAQFFDMSDESFHRNSDLADQFESAANGTLD